MNVYLQNKLQIFVIIKKNIMHIITLDLKFAKSKIFLIFLSIEKNSYNIHKKTKKKPWKWQMLYEYF